MAHQKDPPDWSGAMRKTTAAAYLDLSVPEFLREVAAGRMPAPFKLGRGDHWLRSQIDAAIDVLTGAGDPDWRIGSPLYRDKT